MEQLMYFLKDIFYLPSVVKGGLREIKFRKNQLDLPNSSAR